MAKDPFRVLAVTIVGLVFWGLANIASGTEEPWDSPDYLNFYLGALGLCAAFGYLFDAHPWRWAVIIIFAQWPIMAFTAGLGPLMIVGLGFLTLQLLPAIFASLVTSNLRKLQLCS